MEQPIEIPPDANSLELFCLTDTGTWLPALIVRIDESVIGKSLYAEPLRFQLRFANHDYSKAEYSDRISDAPDTYSNEDDNCYQSAP